jgi:hypothetical protein
MLRAKLRLLPLNASSHQLYGFFTSTLGPVSVRQVGHAVPAFANDILPASGAARYKRRVIRGPLSRLYLGNSTDKPAIEL